MKKIFAFAIIAVAAGVAVGCCPCRFARKNAKPFSGTEWHLVQIAGRDVHFAENTFNVTFGGDGKLTGIGACNRFSAQYKATAKEVLEIGTIAASRMYCPDLDTEQAMFTELDCATHYEIGGSMLFILKNGEIRAIFSAVGSDDAQKIKR